MDNLSSWSEELAPPMRRGTAATAPPLSKSRSIRVSGLRRGTTLLMSASVLASQVQIAESVDATTAVATTLAAVFVSAIAGTISKAFSVFYTTLHKVENVTHFFCRKGR